MKKKIIIKNLDQIRKIREAGKYLNELLMYFYQTVKIGDNLLDLEIWASNFIKQHKLIGAFKGYNNYPSNLCLSVNSCLVHGIPEHYILKSGDLLKIDAGINYQGGIADSAISIVVGSNIKAANLVQATKEGLDKSINLIGPGISMHPFSASIFKYLDHAGYKIIKNLTGHGVGINVHEGPYIYNYPHNDTINFYFQENMVLAFEPITAEISDTYIEYKDKPWNLYTSRGDLGAQWEYTVLITNQGYEILAGII